MNLKLYIIAGEASGDLHGSNLIKELKQLRPDIDLRCWGGDLMQVQGATIVKHYRDLAFMGFTEVVMNLRTILNNIDLCKKDILNNKPDALVLIDYPGFNLRIAEWAKQQGIRVIYYISPQVWAWKQSRVKKIKQCVDQMLVILPFEKAFYQKFDYSVEFVGHPLLDAIESFKTSSTVADTKTIALLPGSRKQEIRTMLPIMLSVQEKFKDYEFVIAGAPSIPTEFYRSVIGKQDISIVYNQTYALLQRSTAALVTSGTATLETALFGVPEVVCYKGGRISYLIAKQLIKIKYISLVNLIMDRPVVKELIQDELNLQNLESELRSILPGHVKRDEMLSNFKLLKQELGGSGASKRAAELILRDLEPI